MMEQQVTAKLAELLKQAVALHGDGQNLPDQIDASANYYEAYGIDSLTGVGFFIEIQRAFKLRIHEADAQKFRSLSEITTYLIDRFHQAESEA